MTKSESKHEMSDDFKDTFVSISLSLLIANAERDVLLKSIELVARAAHMETIEGISFPDWFSQQRVLALEDELVSIEDKNPALAAMLQDHLDKLKRKGGITDSE